MRLVRIYPHSPEWSALIEMGATEFVGEKDASEFWAILSPDPIGVLGFEQISPEVCECELWVKPEVRGRWWSRSFYAMLLGIGFSKAETLVASVEPGSASHALVERLGWKKYCQQGELSYYRITRKDCMGDIASQA